MKLINQGVLITSLSLLFTNSAIAGGISVNHAPVNPTSVPTLGGMMLLTLCLFLAAISFRMAKNKQGSSFFMTMLVASAIVSASGGIKLLSDAHAGAYIETMDIGGGTINFPYDTNGQGTVNNPTNGVPQRVIRIYGNCIASLTDCGAIGSIQGAIIQPGSSCSVSYICPSQDVE